ncbi:tRNA-uridine aminocarboxypropyltransferase [Thalassotalea sp. 1_MG-2023]|uniref:tRNA-uridine aminocarboxypropyltransferase n=1 Tax=Thalassotalea sp. 1_MG-2023 TaxID=3062680 RepID=UPI0026E48E72|nr:tRNA-uridine aminocarboxypropyltransferase [Thalassotalea sp. 1_MG-2023]MDO6427834.1 tRNA-uridine aminocarboxypropyltransferase [Thalassotalea sp. 1_MG-2023]
MHAVHQLYFQRKSQSTKPYNARGKGVKRCELCQLAQVHCFCLLRQNQQSNSSFLLLMHDCEVLKPSNTGRLIADVITDTYAFQWHRTEVSEELINLINHPDYQPYVVFPHQYATDDRNVYHHLPEKKSNKKPLFILLDGSWREAKKMFRKSKYLSALPVLSLSLDALSARGYISTYSLRKAEQGFQLSTAEVASLLLIEAEEIKAAEHLSLWQQLFEYRYRKSVCQPNHLDPAIEQTFITFIKS